VCVLTTFVFGGAFGFVVCWLGMERGPDDTDGRSTPDRAEGSGGEDEVGTPGAREWGGGGWGGVKLQQMDDYLVARFGLGSAAGRARGTEIELKPLLGASLPDEEEEEEDAADARAS